MTETTVHAAHPPVSERDECKTPERAMKQILRRGRAGHHRCIHEQPRELKLSAVFMHP